MRVERPDVRRPALDLGEKLGREHQRIVPRLVPVQLVQTLRHEPAQARRVAEPLRRLASEPVQLRRTTNVAKVRQHAAEIQVHAHDLRRAGVVGNGDARLQIGKPPGIADAGAREPDTVQGVGPDVVEPKIVCHVERLEPDVDRFVVLVADHEESGATAEDVGFLM